MTGDLAVLDDDNLAAALATEAGELLVELRARLHAEGVDGKELKDRGDRESHVLLMQRLAKARPDDGVLSEEGKDDRSRLEKSRVWIVDPLDGTREFGEVPRDDWAVHVALAVDGVVTSGAVALPAQGLTLSTADPAGSLPPAPAAPRLVVSRTRPPAVAVGLAAALGGELVEMGSAGAKAMAILQGRVDIYAHSGGQYEWDSSSTLAVELGVGIEWCRLV
jgi:3'(2'), 5'-bisphosphate nucleotidase